MSAYKGTTASRYLPTYELTVTHVAHDMSDVCER